MMTSRSLSSVLDYFLSRRAADDYYATLFVWAFEEKIRRCYEEARVGEMGESEHEPEPVKHVSKFEVAPDARP